MMSDRSISRTTGVLFIAASAAAIVGGSLDLPATDGTALGEVSRGAVVTGALVEVVLALSVVAIAVTLYPVLRRTDPGMAVGYVAVRTLEAVFVLVGVLSVLVIVSPELGASVAADPRHGVLVDLREWSFALGPVLIFSVSAVVLNALLLRGALVPGWLAWWGLLGGALLLVRGVVEMYEPLAVGVQGVLAAPIGLQEMVLAVWLILRGFAHVAVPETTADAKTTADVR
jgi:Domain of unknown function (DUF4386)